MSEALLKVVSNPAAIRKNPFAILKDLTALVNQAAVGEFENPETQKVVLYALENREHFGGLAPIIDGLLRSRGLYPYLNQSELSDKELLALEAHRPTGLADVVFHQEQAEVYFRLMAGDNVVLSAPTSFGKSLLVDALVASKKYKNIAVIVPTIALIDETRRRLSERFGEKFKLITHASQAQEEKNIYVMTQERILEFEKIPSLDLFVIDEFYKLDPRRDADRSMLLNQAFYRLLKTNAQFYMLGPSIERIPESFTSSIRSRFIATPYSTVVTEHIHVEVGKEDSLQKLIGLCAELKEPTLIYCASPASARRVATALVASRRQSKAKELHDAAEWIGDQYHPEWVVARALSCGVGVHHGKVPRSLSQYSVRAFNDGMLNFLVCTSTLIEGVNTKAKNVIVYDNRVATKKFDYFTFNNIRGRSGRMFHHYIGRVFLFSAPPQDDLPFVDVPVVNQNESTPESLLIQLEPKDLEVSSARRIADLQENSELSLDLLRANAGIDPRDQIALSRDIRSADAFQRLRWSGFPEYEDLEFVCELIWKHFVKSGRLGGVSSGRQLAFRVDRLRRARSIKKLILKELASQESPDADAAVEDVLDFVRTWASFHFPRYLMAVDRIQRAVFLDWIGAAGDYSAYAANVENLFTSSGLIALDEYGLPLQVAEKISQQLGDHSTVDGALAGLRSFRFDTTRSDLSSFEQKLLRDAQLGLGHDRGDRRGKS